MNNSGGVDDKNSEGDGMHGQSFADIWCKYRKFFFFFFSLFLLHVHTKGRQGLTNGLRTALIGYLDRLLFTGGI